jgi:NAD(P)-dependent dehydrogenase (short-subunit alcohol dehydrogenase family)
MPVQTTAIDLAALLAEHLTGDVIAPENPEYDTARRVWNGMIDRRPAVIARCADADDVAAAVRFLLSEDSSMVRGHTLVVDGGYSLPA